MWCHDAAVSVNIKTAAASNIRVMQDETGAFVSMHLNSQPKLTNPPYLNVIGPAIDKRSAGGRYRYPPAFKPGIAQRSAAHKK